MQAGSNLWFWHVLALALGKTVGELQATMTQREFESWWQFYQLRPFDDLHRFHRPAALVAHSLGDGDGIKKTLDVLVDDQLQAVAQIESPDGEFSEADKAIIKALMGG